MEFDVVIVGAGPAGLSVARALEGSGLSVAVVERAPRAALAEPAEDGREIALTHHSVELLQRFAVWERIDPAQVSPMREARVLNGGMGLALRFQPPGKVGAPLGHLVPNHLIRRALFEAAVADGTLTVLDGVAVASVETREDGAAVLLADGRRIAARLVVAADTRFSAIRRQQGIGARMLDFGKTMLVCRMAHEQPHGGVATEWFGHGITIAALPLPGDASGAVVTVPAQEAARLQALDAEAFSDEITQRFGARLGAMRLLGARHAYPLVATYAHRFVRRRLALAGDAAVGMHPVTAHGFNFGLKGADRLAHEIRGAGDPGDAAALARYDRGHRADTLPLFMATNAIAQLYTDERRPARLARAALIGLGAVAAPVRRAIAAGLMDRPRARARA